MDLSKEENLLYQQIQFLHQLHEIIAVSTKDIRKFTT